MHFKKKIRERVYNLYLKGVSLEIICFETNLTFEEADEIIDYMNELYY